MSRDFRPGRAGARWPCTGAVSKLGISGPGHPLFCTYIPDDGVSFRASRVEPGMYASCAHISDSQKTRGYASQAAIRPPIQIEGLAGMLILSSIPPSLPDFFFSFGCRWSRSNITYSHFSPGKYATAAYVSALTKSEKDLSKVESDLKYFHDVLKSDSPDAVKLRSFLTNPTVPAQTRTSTISELLSKQKGGADELTTYVLASRASLMSACD
jgi:hypothetical protein